MLEGKDKNEGSLYSRFILRVLAPPFVMLLIFFGFGLWQLNRVLNQQAVNELKSAATTTAQTLEREFSLRETVLKQTGAEMFIIKSEYNTARKKLDSNRDACRTHIQQKRTFAGAPGGVCDQFLSGFASSASLAALENEYVSLGEQLIQNQNQRINERLSAFKQFFPETLGLVVVDDKKQPVSSALSGVFKGSSAVFQADAVAALTTPIRGKLTTAEGYQLAVFAFPISGGSVLAAYDLQNEHFLRRTWAGAPVDRSRALVVILDSNAAPAYPVLLDGNRFKSKHAELRQRPVTNIVLDRVDHSVVTAPVRSSKWLVAVASPTAAVLAPARDAVLVGLVFIGLFMIGFLWMGTYFIQRMLRNIVGLLSGAIIFGAGRLDYRIALDNADGEFVRLADTMNAMAQRIAAAEQAIDEKNREFISVATHELRAPLTAIIGYLSMFQEDHAPKLDDSGKKLIDQVYYGTVRLRDLVNDMLNVARLESGRAEFTLAPIAINEVIADVADNMSIVAKNEKISISYNATHAAEVMADEPHLRIIVNNFVSNAIKYNRPGGTVTLSHMHKDGQLVTAIADTGLGIPDDQKAKMFEKFFRVQNDDRKNVTGTGLGMYIVKQYIEQMHGQLWFESTHGQGTTFYFSLPLATAAKPVAASQPALPAKSPQTPKSKKAGAKSPAFVVKRRN